MPRQTETSPVSFQYMYANDDLVPAPSACMMLQNSGSFPRVGQQRYEIVRSEAVRMQAHLSCRERNLQACACARFVGVYRVGTDSEACELVTTRRTGIGRIYTLAHHMVLR
jgi:hypothetical protein